MKWPKSCVKFLEGVKNFGWGTTWPPPHEIFLATPLGTILCLSKQFFYKPPIVPVLQKTSKICRTRLQKAPRAFWKHLPNIQHRYSFSFFPLFIVLEGKSIRASPQTATGDIFSFNRTKKVCHVER